MSSCLSVCLNSTSLDWSSPVQIKYYQNYFAKSIILDIVAIKSSTNTESVCDSNNIASSSSYNNVYTETIPNNGQTVLSLGQSQLSAINAQNKNAQYAIRLRNNEGGCMSYASALTLNTANLNPQTSTTTATATATVTSTSNTTTHTPTSTPTETLDSGSSAPDSSNGNSNSLAKILGPIAGVLGLALLLLIGILLYKRSSKKHKSINMATSPQFDKFIKDSDLSNVPRADVEVPQSSPIRLPHLNRNSAQLDPISESRLPAAALPITSEDDDNKPLAHLQKTSSNKLNGTVIVNGWKVPQKPGKAANRHSFALNNNLLSRSSRGSLVVKQARLSQLLLSRHSTDFEYALNPNSSKTDLSVSSEMEPDDPNGKSSLVSSPSHTFPENVSTMSSLSPNSIDSNIQLSESRSTSNDSKHSKQTAGSQSSTPKFTSPSVLSNKGSCSSSLSSRTAVQKSSPIDNGPDAFSPIDLPAPMVSFAEPDSKRSSVVLHVSGDSRFQSMLSETAPLQEICIASSNPRYSTAVLPQTAFDRPWINPLQTLVKANQLQKPAPVNQSFVVIQPATFHPENSSSNPVAPGDVPSYLRPQIVMIPQRGGSKLGQRISVLSTDSSSSSTSYDLEREWLAGSPNMANGDDFAGQIRDTVIDGTAFPCRENSNDLGVCRSDATSPPKMQLPSLSRSGSESTEDGGRVSASKRDSLLLLSRRTQLKSFKTQMSKSPLRRSLLDELSNESIEDTERSGNVPHVQSNDSAI